MISGFDKRGNDLGTIDFIETQWNRRWSSCGDFTVYLAAKNYDPNVKYVKNHGRPETGIVQKVVYDEKPEGQFLTLSGFFVDKLADMGTSRADWSGVISDIDLYMDSVFSSVPNGNRLLAGDNLYDYNIDESSDALWTGTNKILISRGVAAGEGIRNAFTENGYSFYCVPIYAPEDVDESEDPIIGLSFMPKKGKDLSDEVYFGEAYNNVKNIIYTLDESAEKSCYEVLLKVDTLEGWSSMDATFSEKVNGETVNWVVKTYVCPTNQPTNIGNAHARHILEASVSGIDLVPQNEAEIIEEMLNQAKLDMLNHYKIETIEVSVLQERFLYLRDYDLGDVCSIYVNALQQMYSARIEEVREVHVSNRVDVEIVLGTPTRQKWRVVT